MRLTAYQLFKNAPLLQAAPHQRDWMDETPNRYAYLCFPLVNANKSGWELLSPIGFTAVWNGAAGVERVTIEADTEGAEQWVYSHFGSGIVTLRTGYLFRTEPGHNLLVKGSPNRFKDGIAPLEAVVETDWLPNSFTMNWKFTRPDHPVRFEAGEPFCFVAPTPMLYLSEVEPSLRAIASDPEVSRHYAAWIIKRGRFNSRRDQSDTEEARQAWLKDYLKGQNAVGDQLRRHPTSFRLKEFVLEAPSAAAQVEPGVSAEKVADANGE